MASNRSAMASNKLAKLHEVRADGIGVVPVPGTAPRDGHWMPRFEAHFRSTFDFA